MRHYNSQLWFFPSELWDVNNSQLNVILAYL